MSRPPGLAVAIVQGIVADSDLRDATLGDLAEDFERLSAERSPRAARAWYWSQVIRSVVPLSLLALRGGFVPWLRLVASVVLGYAALAVLVIATNFWLMARLGGGAASWVLPAGSLALGVLCALVSGALAAVVGGRSPLFSATVLGLLCVSVSGWLLVHGGDGSPLWYQIALMVVVLPSVVIGALALTSATRRAARKSQFTSGDAP